MITGLFRTAALSSLLVVSACVTPQYPAGAQASPAPVVPGPAPSLSLPAPQYPVAPDSASSVPVVPAVTERPASPVVAVQSTALPPVAEPAPQQVAVQTTPDPEPAATTVVPVTPEPPVPAPKPAPPKPAPVKMITVAAGPIVVIDGPPATYIVKKGDRLDAIARALDTTREELAEDNRLEPPYPLQPGQLLKGPKTTRKAYVVQTNDTLFAISQRFGTKPDALAALNGLKKGAAIRKGQKLILPDGFKDRGAQKRPAPDQPAPVAKPAPVPAKPAVVAPKPVTPPATTTPKPVVTEAPKPVVPTAPKPVTPVPVVPKPVSPPPPASPRPQVPDVPLSVSDAQISALAKGRFSWPVQGEVISTFGPKGAGQRNDGINISAPAGAPVLSAADGEVVYAGNQVQGFGNLVLIKHSDGWVTAYAHLDATKVAMRQMVKRGDLLGTVGTSGGVGSPQLHFEVRYAPSAKEKARAINPALVLPR